MNREGWLYYWLQGKKEDIRFAKFKAAWRKNNQHNGSYPGVIYPAERVSVGKMTYGEINVFGFDRPDTILSIGNFCSLAGDVQFWIGGEHPTKFVSTFPFAYKMGWEERLHPDLASKGSIVVEDDVWIGERTIILSGVHIGQGSIIGAGSIVTKDVPPYSIYVGNRILRGRFDDKVIAALKTIDYSRIDIEKMRAVCDTVISTDNYEEIINKIV